MVLAATVVGRIRTESRRAFVLLDIIFTCELITETTLFQLPCYGDKTDGGFTEMLCHLVRRKCRQYLQVILLPGGWMVFPSSSVKLLLTSCQSIFSCIDRASVVSRSCRRVFSGNASTATGVSGILKVTGRAKPPLFPSGITINGRMLKISLTRWLNAVTVVPAMFVYDARRLPLFPVAAHSASEYRQPATDTAGVTIRHCIPG